ncbi:MAG: glycosyltransferase family 9 protein [Armatimonadetes bacterium]|nr:glycosyltransferase family 9 protein [Armatimonadota bacterium]MDW8122019.1 glycosyltransferase family 9 protein [Armatimonadota bacterium]
MTDAHQSGSSVLAGYQRILLIRLSALGDTLAATPAAQVVKEALPNVHLGWVVSTAAFPIVEGNPHIDDIYIWDGRLRTLPQLAGLIRRDGYEVSVDLQGLLKSSVIAWLAKIPRRISFANSREGSRFFATDCIPVKIRYPSGASRTLSLLAALGLPVSLERHRMLLPLSDRHRQVALEQLNRWNLTPKSFAVLAPATTRPQKHWPVERWSQLADGLRQRLGLPSLLLGSPSDRALLEVISSSARTPIPHLWHLSLKEAGALIEQALVLIGPDSFPIHAANALGTYTVALFGSTSGDRFRSEPAVRVLEHPLPCRPCGRRPTCGGAFPCMRLITVEEVIGAVDSLTQLSYRKWLSS